jgi:hypothetical protein
MFTSAIAWLGWLPYPAVLLLILFIAITILFSYLEGLSTGWIGLARKFRDKTPSYSYQWRNQDVRLENRLSYYACVHVGADEKGLYMGEGFLFRVGHPPLFIPWSEIQVLSGEHGWLFKRRKLKLGREELVQISISKSFTEELKKAAGRSWPGDTVWR